MSINDYLENLLIDQLIEESAIEELNIDISMIQEDNERWKQLKKLSDILSA